MNRETLEQRAARINAPDTDETRRDREQREHMRRMRLAEAQAAVAALRRMERHRQRGAAMLALLLAVFMAAAAVAAGHFAELRVRQALAQQCAVHSAGADSDIARCYTSRDLPLPEGI